MPSPYARLNLRRNPFGELTRAEWVEAAVVNLDKASQQLGEDHTIVQLLAQHGRGKTTHLLALAERFPNATYCRASRDPLPANGDLLLLDEADSLWTWQRIGLIRRFKAIAYSTHRNLSFEFQLFGKRVETHTVGTTNLEALIRIVERRMMLAQHDSGPIPIVQIEHLRLLQTKHGDNLRAIFDELYHHIQQQTRTHV